jgi:hypothetical protein|tara:strand:- start:598 stop:1206 length:609 start_codon:yes stop_codon:yes gene_type:complete
LTDRVTTGWILIAAAILGFGGWILWGALMGFPDSSDGDAIIKASSDNKDLTIIIFTVASIGFALMVMGFRAVASNYGNDSVLLSIGKFMLIPGLAISLVESASIIGIAQAGPSAVADTLFALSVAAGGIGTSLLFGGIGLIGLTFLMQKSLHVVVGILMVVGGVVGLVVPLIDYTLQIMFIAYICMVASALAIAIPAVRSKE